MPAAVPASHNAVLARLDRTTRERLLPHLSAVPLKFGERLAAAEQALTYAYFPERGAVSLVANLSDGNTLEVGMIGPEGVMGANAVLGIDWMPCSVIVQVPGLALAIRIDVLQQEAARSRPLHDVLSHHVQLELASAMQTAVCNNFHPVESRCARWLLQMHDMVGSHLEVSQEFLAQMLGVRRPTVTLLLGSFERAGVVACGRRRIEILDRRHLEEIVCECYAALKQSQHRLDV